MEEKEANCAICCRFSSVQLCEKCEREVCDSDGCYDAMKGLCMYCQESRQALLIRPDGTKQEIKPANGSKFTRMEVYRLLGAIPTYNMDTGDSYIYVGEDNLFAGENTFDILECTESKCKYMRDGYIFDFNVPFNERATKMWGNEKHRLHGNVVIIPIEQSFD